MSLLALRISPLRQSEDKMCFSAFLFTQANKLGICSSFRSTVVSIVPLRIQTAWTVKQNSMRGLYRLNWPCRPNAQSMGQGRWVIFSWSTPCRKCMLCEQFIRLSSASGHLRVCLFQAQVQRNVCSFSLKSCRALSPVDSLAIFWTRAA